MKKRRRKRKRRIRILPLLLVILIPVSCAFGLKYGVQFLQDTLHSNEADTSLGWNLILVNEDNVIPDDWTVDLITLDNGEQVDARIYPSLQAMFDQARNEGLQLFVRSGYRTSDDQKSVYQDYVNQYLQQGYMQEDAESYASEYVSAVGKSEHQLGIAVDINADGDTSDADVYAWLDANAYLYGFIQRYPSNKTAVTGINNEPWHYRYVGEEAAQYMHEYDLCLEEYIAQLKQ